MVHLLVTFGFTALRRFGAEGDRRLVWMVFADAVEMVVVESAEIEAERELVVDGRLGQEVLVGERGEVLGGGGCDASESCGEPGLRGDGDLGAACGDGVVDAVGGVADGGGYDGRGGGEVEPARFLLLIADEGGMDVRAGTHEAGADGGDADAFVAELGVEALREADEGELAGDVGQKVRDGDLAADGGDVDDRGGAFIRDAEHVRKGGSSGVEGGEEVGCHGAAIGGERLVFDGTDLDDSGVVDEDVDAAEVGDGVIDKVFGLRGVCEVGGDEKDRFGGSDGVAIEQGVASADELIDVAGREDEAAAGATEALGERETEAAGASGDEDDFIFIGTAPWTWRKGVGCRDGSEAGEKFESGGGSRHTRDRIRGRGEISIADIV